MSIAIIRADAARLPLPDASVDLVVTSPPYFGLRSYTDGGEHYDGQVGSEATPREYLAALWACTAEWARVLKPEGSLFVNLGDKYGGSDAGSKPHTGAAMSTSLARSDGRLMASLPAPGRPKSLMGMPWRYALGCVDALGLILRAEVIWAKPNGLPESVTDRVRRSHEQIFHMVKSPRYFSAVDEVREAHSGPWKSPGSGNPAAAVGPQSRNGHSQWERSRDERDATVRNPLGKLPGSVWEIASQPLTVPASLGVDHFAAFPMELPRRIILGWSPSGVCTACGQGRRPVSVTWLGRKERNTPAYGAGNHGTGRSTLGSRGSGAAITGYACACPDATAPARPAVVLDPFGGTGTTALVASVLGRTGISADRSADYCRLAQWRVTDPGERARALQVPKPPPVADGQASLFDAMEAI